MESTSNNMLLQDVILELQISNENVSGIETGVTMLTDSISKLSVASTKDNSQLIERDDRMITVLKTIGLVNTHMLNTMDRLYKFFMDNDMVRAEEHRDLVDAIEDIGKGSGQGGATFDTKKPKGILGLLAGVAAFAAGVLIGFFEELVRKLKMLGFYERVLEVFGKIGKMFASIGEFIAESKLYQKVEEAFSKVGSIFGGIGRFFGKIGSVLGRVLEPALNFIREMPISRFIGKIARMVGKVFRLIMKPIKFIMKLFGSAGGAGALGKIFKLGKGLGKVLGKLALPITIIMGIVESAMGAFEGYKTGGIMGAIKGGLKGLLNSLIGWMIDIPKDLISWLLDMFGFKNASKWLDSWDFGTLFDGLWKAFSDLWDGIVSALGAVSDWWSSWSFDGVFTSIKDFFFGIWDDIIDWLKNAGTGLFSIFGNALDAIQDFERAVLREILPDPTKHTSMADPLYWVAKAVPDAVYDFAKVQQAPNIASNNIQAMPGTNGGALMSSGSGGANVTIINDYSKGPVTTNVTAANIGQRGQTTTNNAGGSTYSH